MVRFVPLLLAAFLFSACDSGSSGDAGTGADSESGKSGRNPSRGKAKTGAAATTGTPVFQRETEAIARDLKELETRKRPTDAAALAAFQREVRMKIEHIDVTLLALEVSIKAEAKQIVEKSHGALLLRRAAMNKEIDGLWREISEIREVLEAAKKGTDEIPPGLTKDELKDNLGDLEARMRAERTKRTQINTELETRANQLNSKQYPDQGATTLTQEREILRQIKARAEKLATG